MTSADFLRQTFFDWLLTIADFKASRAYPSAGSPRLRHLSFSLQPLDLLSWFYVYLSDFGLLGNLIHHLASSGFCA